MRTVKSILLFLVAFVTFAVSAHAAALTLRIQDTAGRPGGSVRVPVEVSAASNLGSMHLEVTYDPSILQATDVTAASLASGALVDFNLQQPGRAVIGLASANGISGAGDLVSITFDVIGHDGESTTLNLENVQATDISFNPIQTSVVSGRLRVGGGFGALGFLALIVVFAGLGIAGYVYTRQTTRKRTVEPAHLANLRVISGFAHPATLDLDGGPVYIGRAQNNNLVIHDDYVSRRHAVLQRTPDGYAIRDLNSAGGTRVNGHPITYIALQSGDRIQIGDAELQFTEAASRQP